MTRWPAANRRQRHCRASFSSAGAGTPSSSLTRLRPRIDGSAGVSFDVTAPIIPESLLSGCRSIPHNSGHDANEQPTDVGMETACCGGALYDFVLRAPQPECRPRVAAVPAALPQIGDGSETAAATVPADGKDYALRRIATSR